MKIKQFKKLIPAIALIALLASMSSCNRGMGCPNNFSLSSAAGQVIDVIEILPDLLLRE